MRKCATALCAALLCAEPLSAQVVTLEIDSREPMSLGQQAGAAGPFELIRGRIHGEADPGDPHNAIIHDLSLAPRNARGKVEYVATFALAKIGHGDGQTVSRAVAVELPVVQHDGGWVVHARIPIQGKGWRDEHQDGDARERGVS